MHEQEQSADVPTAVPHTEYVFFRGSRVGSHGAPNLEGVLVIPSGAGPRPGVVLCHANPKAGGHMEMKVLQAIASALAEKGIASLRYNSRGIGRSEGEISGYSNRKLVTPEGEPETADVGSALEFVGAQEGVDPARLALVGHSFGARISLAYLEQHPDDDLNQGSSLHWTGRGVGRPLAPGPLDGAEALHHGRERDFCPPELLEKFVAGLPEPATQVVLRNTGHFFEGREDNLASVVAEYLGEILFDF